MKKIINECCNCAVPGHPCRGSRCPRLNVVRYFCEECKEEIHVEEDGLYESEGKEICIECLKKRYEKEPD